MAVGNTQHGERILEIGVGAYPFPPRPPIFEERAGNDRYFRFDKGGFYVGVDRPVIPGRYWQHEAEEPKNDATDTEKQKGIGNLADAQKRFANPDEHIQFMVADAHDLPFRVNTFDTVYMGDVFGSQLLDSSTKAILENLQNVVRPAGKLVIRECISPFFIDLALLQQTLNNHNFIDIETHHYGEAGYDELQSMYGATIWETEAIDGLYPDDMFFLTARNGKAL